MSVAPNFLKSNQSKIRKQVVNLHIEKFDSSKWDVYFKKDVEYNRIKVKHPAQLSRADIFKIAKSLKLNYSTSLLKELFIASMIWGYGKVGYGAFRTWHMCSDPHFLDTLSWCHEELEKGMLLKAYRLFQVNKCGPAFMSKFFYFCSSSFSQNHHCLILDSVVADKLQRKCGVNISLYAKYAAKNGAIVNVDRYDEGYLEYNKDMRDWAGQIHVNPDQIEYFLFRC